MIPMKKYIKYLIYYFLSYVDSTVNFLCSIFGVYPGMETSETFLINRELLKTNNFIDKRSEEKQQKMNEAEQQADFARSLLKD